MRLSELYTSTQGEGPNTGRLVQFVRFAGCNLRCPGWPCDTQHAINPDFFLKEGNSQILTPEQLVDMTAAWPRRLCLTGGEPFAQRSIDLQQYVEAMLSEGYSIECFTNGTFVFPAWAKPLQFMMDWKLPGSGEADASRDNRLENALRLRRTDGIKFVVVDRADMDTALQEYAMLQAHGVEAEFWIAAAWGKVHDQDIVQFLQENQLPWRLNVQVHKYVWDPDKRGV